MHSCPHVFIYLQKQAMTENRSTMATSTEEQFGRKKNNNSSVKYADISVLFTLSAFLHGWIAYHHIWKTTAFNAVQNNLFLWFVFHIKTDVQSYLQWLHRVLAAPRLLSGERWSHGAVSGNCMMTHTHTHWWSHKHLWDRRRADLKLKTVQRRWLILSLRVMKFEHMMDLTPGCRYGMKEKS